MGDLDMSIAKRFLGGLGLAFAVVAMVRCDQLRFAPEDGTDNLFDKAIVTANNWRKVIDIPNEDELTKATFTAFYISEIEAKIDKASNFSKQVFGVDLDSNKFTKAQSQEKLYSLFKANPFGVESHGYDEGVMRGFYYFAIYKSTGDLARINTISSEQLSTQELAARAAEVGKEKIQPELDKLKSIGNAAFCFQVAALVKARGLDAAVNEINHVNSAEMADYFYKKVHQVFGEETEIIIKQAPNHNEIAKNPQVGTYIGMCAAQPQIALGRL